jgi:hypothetical protein
VTPRQRLVVLAAGAAVALAGCTSSGGVQKADDPVISPTPTTASASSTSAPAPTTTAAPSPSPSPSSSTVVASSATPAPATGSSSAPAAVVAKSTCTKIGIRILPGGATFGEEIAGLQFTNEGTQPCRLVGYPTVTLLRHGRPVGRPSQPTTTANSERTLAPGEVAESLLHNHIRNCQAPLSDTVRVVAPGSTISGSRPMQLRACVVRIDRLGAPD